jgi:hypothetical protein
MRRLRLAMTLLLVCGSLTGCGPPPEPLVAVAMRDGQPVVILVTCVGEFSQLGVFRNDPTARSTASPNVHVSWGVHGDAPTEVVEVAVFGQPPAGWETEGERQIGDPSAPGSFKVEPLRELVPGVRYSASGSSHRRAYSVDFTVAGLGRLKGGYVRTTDDDGDTRIATFDDFVRAGRNSRGRCRRP